MEIVTLKTGKVLSPTQITLADYTINTYRGCEFGCLYCYSQSNKNIKDESFFNCLGIKPDAPNILAKELKYRRPKRVLLGSTTECFQYQEREEKTTEAVLKLLNAHNIPYTILTKSALIADYLELISKNKANKVYFTLNFASDDIVRLLESKSSSVGTRIRAIEKILRYDIDLRIHIGPFIPHLSDLEKILKNIPQEVKEVDIELYHKKQGNFPEIIEKIKDTLGSNIADDIQAIYASKDAYYNFAAELEKRIHTYSRIYPFKFFYLVPEFDNFYTPSFDYEKPIF